MNFFFFNKANNKLNTVKKNVKLSLKKKIFGLQHLVWRRTVCQRYCTFTDNFPLRDHKACLLNAYTGQNPRCHDTSSLEIPAKCVQYVHRQDEISLLVAFTSDFLRRVGQFFRFVVFTKLSNHTVCVLLSSIIKCY
jgi:hypothetical protein